MGLIVTLAHLRSIPGYGKKPGFCASGAREWFARHELDWCDFLSNGIAAEVLLATDCALAKALVEHAQKVSDGQQ